MNDDALGVCVRVLVPKDLCGKKPVGLKPRDFKCKFLQSPLRNYSPHLTEIVCKALCLWHDYWFF